MQRYRIGQDRIEENNLEWDGMDRKQSFEYNKGIILIRKKKNFNPFFDWVTFLKNIELLSFLYILMIISLSITSFTDIFSQPKDSLFIFVYGFLCCAKDFECNQVLFIYFSLTLGDGSKKVLLQFMSKTVVAVFLQEFNRASVLSDPFMKQLSVL